MSEEKRLEAYAEFERQYQLVKKCIETYGKEECERILKPQGRAGWVSLAALESLASMA